MAAEASEPQGGDIVDGRYELESIIGAGGMGQVWSARDRQLESACAVKFILGHMAQDKHVRGRFAREAKAVAALRTSHVVQVFGLGEHRGVPYIAMELLEGETLRGRLSREGRLDAKTTLAIVEQVVHALDRARAAQIVHRDLKPENIWLSSEREVFVKILDFGVAKAQLTTSSLQTVTGALLGTPYYMSPEQALGKTALDYRSDLWAVAIIAVECLSGRRPFESESLSELLINICTTTPPPVAAIAPQLPAALQAFWERGLAREPDQRFQSGSELLEALRRSLSEQPAAAPPASSGRVPASTTRAAVSVSPMSSTRSGRQHKNWARHAIAATVGLALTAGLVVTAVRMLGGSESTPPRAGRPKSEAAAEAAAAPDKVAAPAENATALPDPGPDRAVDSAQSNAGKATEPEAPSPVIKPIAEEEAPAEQQPKPAEPSKATLAAELQALTGAPPPRKPVTQAKPSAPPRVPPPPPAAEPAPAKSKSDPGRRDLGI